MHLRVTDVAAMASAAMASTEVHHDCATRTTRRSRETTGAATGLTARGEERRT